MANKSLVIVESPAKAKTINKYLGKDFTVTASVGHIIDLPQKKIGINFEDNFKPEYVTIPGKEKIIKELRDKSKKADSIYIATDPDREGEAIAYHIASILNRSDGIFRVEFNEITKNAVEKAMKSPRTVDMDRVYSQQARRVLDRIVGYKISPLLWKMIYKGLSAGRVQSVALRLICEREEEIRDFKPQEFWTIQANAQQKASDKFSVKLVKISNKKVKINNQQEAEEHKAAIKNGKFILSGIEKKELKRNPGPPFITSTLQQTASRMLRMPTKRIMSIAQGLYEGIEIPGHGSVGLITYMRTDSTRISQEALNAAHAFISEQYGAENSLKKPRVFRSKKSAQDAHEAIRPTYVDKAFSPDEIKEHLSAQQYKLYNLIWKRFIASQMPVAIFEKTTIRINDGKYEFSTEGEILKYAGFTMVYNEVDEDKEQPASIPANLAEGDSCKILNVKADQNFTKPKPRFTESTLVKELDSLSIGRPSTYAQIISTILQRQYVELQERKLHATELGETVNTILVTNFPEIFNVSFTATMEKELDDIASNKLTYEKVLSEFYSPFEQAMKEVDLKKDQIKSDLVEDSGEVCEKCGSPMVIRWGRNGKFMACSGFPKCKNTKPLNEPDEPEMTDEKCDKCGSSMVVKTGRFGKFLACSNYPTCKSTKPISTGIKCPKEGCDGDVIERRSKRGRVFYGCSKYPKCDFVSWDKPVNQPCLDCGNNYVTEKYSKAKGSFLRCPVCKHETAI